MTDPDPIVQAASLEKSMNRLGEKITGLTKYGKRSRHLIVALACSLAFDILLSAMLGLVALSAKHASERATVATSAARTAHNGLVLTCQAGNEARKTEIQLWDYVITLSADQPPPPGQTVAQHQQVIDQFLNHLHTVFAPRDCSKVG